MLQAILDQLPEELFDSEPQRKSFAIELAEIYSEVQTLNTFFEGLYAGLNAVTRSEKIQGDAGTELGVCEKI